jgi:hypothetical protein
MSETEKAKYKFIELATSTENMDIAPQKPLVEQKKVEFQPMHRTFTTKKNRTCECYGKVVFEIRGRKMPYLLEENSRDGSSVILLTIGGSKEDILYLKGLRPRHIIISAEVDEIFGKQHLQIRDRFWDDPDYKGRIRVTVPGAKEPSDYLNGLWNPDSGRTTISIRNRKDKEKIREVTLITADKLKIPSPKDSLDKDLTSESGSELVSQSSLGPEDEDNHEEELESDDEMTKEQKLEFMKKLYMNMDESFPSYPKCLRTIKE